MSAFALRATFLRFSHDFLAGCRLCRVAGASTPSDTIRHCRSICTSVGKNMLASAFSRLCHEVRTPTCFSDIFVRSVCRSTVIKWCDFLSLTIRTAIDFCRKCGRTSKTFAQYTGILQWTPGVRLSYTTMRILGTIVFCSTHALPDCRLHRLKGHISFLALNLFNYGTIDKKSI